MRVQGKNSLGQDIFLSFVHDNTYLDNYILDASNNKLCHLCIQT